MARRAQTKFSPQQVTIERLSHEGRGIAHLDGKTLFVRGALAGERVEAVVTRRHAKFDEAVATQIFESSPQRVIPPCPHEAICGGCSLMHLEPRAQIAHKQATLAEHFAHFGQLTPQVWREPLRAETLGYRRKARLGVKFVAKKNKVLVGFREKASPYLAEIDHCMVLDPRVGLKIQALSELIADLRLRDRIPQIEVAMDDTAVALVFRHLDPLPSEDHDRLVDFGRAHGFQIYGQGGGPSTLTALWPEQPQLQYQPVDGVHLHFAPTDFTQVNAGINRRMVPLAMAMLDLQPNDSVLDLFSGLGNFTLPIAQRVARVVAVEGDASLVAHGQANAKRNNLEQAHFEQADLTQTHLRDYPWAAAGFDKVLLDPPRSGALEVMPQLAELGAERLVYVSCNPATLARDAGVLVHDFGYQLREVGVMDMFPHTAHVESIALFTRSN